MSGHGDFWQNLCSVPGPQSHNLHHAPDVILSSSRLFWVLLMLILISLVGQVCPYHGFILISSGIIIILIIDPYVLPVVLVLFIIVFRSVV